MLLNTAQKEFNLITAKNYIPPNTHTAKGLNTLILVLAIQYL